MQSAHNVAAALLEQLGEMTTMKLQKLVYYSQAWHLAKNNRPLFSEEIQAWVDGPVVRALYDVHKHSRYVSQWPQGKAEALSEIEFKTVRWVAENYGQLSAEQLSTMTHKETPWLSARVGYGPTERSNEIILVDEIREHYAKQPAAPGEAVTHAVANAELEGGSVNTEHRNRLQAVADGRITAEDAVNQVLRRIRRA